MNNLPPQAAGPIGVFDSGYGGLTILKAIRELLPQSATMHARRMALVRSM